MNLNAALKHNAKPQAVAEIAALLGDRLSTSQAVRDQHGDDLTWNPGAAPDAVAFVESTQEVQRIVEICGRYEVPVVPYGTGTSLEGHISAPFGGVCIDTSRMNQVLVVNAEDLDCTVQPGITRKALNEYLRDTGLFFPVDPGADASIGGMTATRASGTNAVRYGTMRENVLGLTAVMPNGEIVRTARRAKKSSAGYDLTKLLVGSEGTLGVITEINLKLQGIPECIMAGVCPFPSIEGAVNAVIMAVQIGLPVARMELVDEENLRAINLYSKLDLPEVPTLFLEFHGTDAWAKEQVEVFREIAAELGAGDMQWAEREEERNRLWQARHDAFWAVKALHPNKAALSTDVCVPVSRLAECIEATRKDLSDNDIYGPIIGHVGDGNFHSIFFFDLDDDAEMARIRAAYERLIMRALEMDGTCTGEHGIGRGKMKFLELEHGAGVGFMKQIKQAIDPKNIMNPGKIISL